MDCSKADTGDGLNEAVTIGNDAYVSADYARAEAERLWSKVWQQVGRLEELPDTGSYITYDILDQSVIVVRTGEGTLRAFHNVCPHRGRQLVDKPEGARHASGRIRNFWCNFHGWS